MSNEYWYISWPSINGCSPTKTYQRRARAEWLCRGCSTVLPGVGPLDAEVQEKHPPSEIDEVLGLTVIRRELLDAIGHDIVDSYTHRGKVIAGGVLLSDWQCFHPKQRIIVRGQTSVRHRRCEVCGRDIYSALERDSLCPEPPSDVPLMSTAGGGCLVVTAELKRRIEQKHWKHIHLQRLEVLDSPRDGLPRDLIP